jgi:glutamyl-tRNA synthetase
VGIRGRFAPSPTGDLHLGNARTALLAWLQVRSAGGTFVLRVEDLDTGRVRPGKMERQLDDLRWLGLDWDEGPDVGGPYAPYVQSARRERYEQALTRLAAERRIYACACSRRDVATASSAPHGIADDAPRYPGTCRGLSPAALEEKSGGGPMALRFRVEPGKVCFDDLIAGPQCHEPDAEGGDFVVRRKDGVAAYQLAVVVDDAAMCITHVLRGADLLASTARQLRLYDALGLAAPAWAHVPLLRGPDGERLSKRHGAVSLAEYRERGTRPEALVGWLAASCGLAEPGEAARPADLIERFSLERLPREPTVLAGLPPLG